MRVCAPTPYKYSVGRICVCVLAKCRRKTQFTRIRYMATMAHAVGAAHDVLETLALTPGRAARVKLSPALPVTGAVKRFRL